MHYETGHKPLMKYLKVVLVEFPSKVKCKLLSGLGDIEYRLNLGCTENIQLVAMVALFGRAKAETLKNS